MYNMEIGKLPAKPQFLKETSWANARVLTSFSSALWVVDQNSMTKIYHKMVRSEKIESENIFVQANFLAKKIFVQKNVEYKNF